MVQASSLSQNTSERGKADKERAQFQISISSWLDMILYATRLLGIRLVQISQESTSLVLQSLELTIDRAS